MTFTNSEFLYWGPFVVKFEVEDYITKHLLKRGDEIKLNDHRQKLAGHIDRENFYTQEDIDWFVKHTNKYFDNYIKHKENVWTIRSQKIELLKNNPNAAL